ncbi:GPI mannosyltransferase 2 [Aspergillus desertorum]
MSPASWAPEPTARLPCVLDPSRPVKALSVAFWLWKAILFVAIIGSPGLGYDTSSSLLPLLGNGSVEAAPGKKHVSFQLPIPLKFVRWDSIYFVHIGQIGYVFEQEWAFSSTYGYLVNSLSSFLFPSHDSSGAAEFAVTAVVLSHVAHYLSVLVLYRLSLIVFGHETERKRVLCFLSAALHIISPAGAFLSAPYGESLFSFLNMTGFYIYSSSLVDFAKRKQSMSDVKLIISGCLFAVATAVRSNGILNGILLAYDAFNQAHNIIARRSSRAAVRLCFVILSGCTVALGFIIPQSLAYIAYCMNEGVSRPWCQSLVPSIYGWVQAHYWGVGFFRYWAMSNLPLFLLASPMLLVLFLSCLWALRVGVSHSLCMSTKAGHLLSARPSAQLIIQLAIAQLVLVAMALTTYHVQIINRISSGYPLWYWYLANRALETTDRFSSASRYSGQFMVFLQAMVIYALVQGVLFGSFLPPA